MFICDPVKPVIHQTSAWRGEATNRKPQLRDRKWIAQVVLSSSSQARRCTNPHVGRAQRQAPVRAGVEPLTHPGRRPCVAISGSKSAHLVVSVNWDGVLGSRNSTCAWGSHHHAVVPE